MLSEWGIVGGEKSFKLDCQNCGKASDICKTEEEVIKNWNNVVKRPEPETLKERLIMNNLVKAWNEFISLEPTHPCDQVDFMNGIHACQNVIFGRIVRRDYPQDFPSYIKERKN